MWLLIFCIGLIQALNINLLKNSNFEEFDNITGQPAYWMQGFHNNSNHNIPLQNHSIFKEIDDNWLVSFGSDRYRIGNQEYIYQRFEHEVNRSVRLEFDLKVIPNLDSDKKPSIQLQIFVMGHSEIYNRKHFQIYTTWTRFQLKFLSYDIHNKIVLFIFETFEYNQDIYLFDNIYLFLDDDTDIDNTDDTSSYTWSLSNESSSSDTSKHDSLITIVLLIGMGLVIFIFVILVVYRLKMTLYNSSSYTPVTYEL